MVTRCPPQWEGLLFLAARPALGLLHQHQNPTMFCPTQLEQEGPGRPLGGDRCHVAKAWTITLGSRKGSPARLG